jgi:hypothetical protein
MMRGNGSSDPCRTISVMEHQDCEPPRDRVLVEDLPKDRTCSECGDAWQACMLTPPTVPAPRYVFLLPAGGYYEGDAEWVRIGKPDA